MMTKDDKVAFILHDLAKNFDLFTHQAKVKLYKHRKLVGEGQEYEIVSDVLFSVIDKLKTEEIIDRFYNMAEASKLSLYILKAVSTNTSYYSSPYLQKKIKETNHFHIFDNLNYYQIETPEDYDIEESKLVMDTSIVFAIKDMLEPPKAINIFGKEDWEYYTRIFKEYISSPCSYQSLSDKYDIPKSNIAFHIRKVKNLIKDELDKTNLKRIY